MKDGEYHWKASTLIICGYYAEYELFATGTSLTLEEAARECGLAAKTRLQVYYDEICLDI